MIDRGTFEKNLNANGYHIARNVFAPDFMDHLAVELKQAIMKEAEFHGSASHKDYGMLLACPIYGGSFLDVLSNREFLQPFNWALGETCIIYVYTSSSLPPNGTNRSSRIHVDRPTLIPGYMESLACLIAVSDFSEENGATRYLPGSHIQADPPTKEHFELQSERLVISKGSVFYFNPRLWHSGGVNETNQWRHAVGMAMVRPSLKQRIDLPRAMAHLDFSAISGQVKQKLGFFAQPPASLEEYYAPSEKRPYTQPSEWETGQNFRSDH